MCVHERQHLSGEAAARSRHAVGILLFVLITFSTWWLLGCSGSSGDEAGDGAPRNTAATKAKLDRKRILDLLTSVPAWDAATRQGRQRAAEHVASLYDGIAFTGLFEPPAGPPGRQVAVFRDENLRIDLVLVPGCVDEEPATRRSSNRGTTADTSMAASSSSGPLLLSRTEIPQRVWTHVTGANPSRFRGSDRPVESVSWETARSVAAEAGYRFPTRDEWTRARGEVPDSDDPQVMGNHADEARLRALAEDMPLEDALKKVTPGYDDGFAETADVAQFRPNEWGLFDMLGNVWEWCEDYDRSLSSDPAALDAAAAQGHRVGRALRGGSWLMRLNITKDEDELHFPTTGVSSDIGVRLARSVDVATAITKSD